MDRRRLLEALTASAQGPDPDMRIGVANILGELNDLDADGVLVTLAEDESPRVRYYATFVCGYLLRLRAASEGGDSAALEAVLRAALRDGHRGPAEQAAIALKEVGWRPQELEERAYYEVARGEWEEALALGESAREAFLHALKTNWWSSLVERDSTTSPPPPPLEAIKGVGTLGDRRAVPTLLEIVEHAATGDGSWEQTGRSAVDALGTIGDPAAVEPLMTVMESGSPALRGSAAWALGKLGDERAVPLLIDALDDPEVHYSAAQALGLLRAAEAVDRLCEIAGDKEAPTNVRRMVIEALGQIGEPKACEALVALLGKDEEEKLRKEAATSLGALGDAEAVDPLLNALVHDPKWAVGEAAAAALGHVGGPAAVAALREAGVNRRAAGHTDAIVAALAAISGAAAADALFGLLESAPHLKVDRVEGLGKYHLAIALALAERGDPRAEVLLENLRQTSHRIEAGQALDLLRARSPGAAKAPAPEGESPTEGAEGAP